ncbi:MAG TPA: SDR family oxidoreductase [Beijerinckiaceae bacterium]|jgi:3-oxoacyl-[acyl-carrier protein] reductase
MNIDLTGKVALVTGASRGIGAATALALAQAGADVAISHANSAEAAETVAKNIRALGRRAEVIRADQADPAAVDALVRSVAEGFGRLDILVNNAGVFATGMVGETTDADYERQFAVNVRAVFAAVRTASTVMGEGGRIISTGSVLGDRTPFPGGSIYSATKAAVASLTRGWARDLASRGITVNAVQPGPIDTEMNPANGDHAAALTAGTALGRYGRPEEIAAAVVFLASPQASYITGTTLDVDGGYNA